MNRLIIDKWFGGMSGDNLYVNEGQYDYSKNIDITNTSYITLGKRATKLATTGGESVYAINVATSSTSYKTFFFTENAKVYSTNSSDDTEDYDLSTIDGIDTRPILNTFRWGGYLYMLQDGSYNNFYIHRILESDAYSGDWDNTEARYITREPGTNDSSRSWYPLIVNQSGYVYIGNGREVVGFNLATGGAAAQAIGGLSSDVRGITMASNTVKVYTKDGFVLYYNSELDLQERVYITISPKVVATIKGVDYIIGGYTDDYIQSLYYMNGYRLETLFETDNNGIYPKFRIIYSNPNAIQFDGKNIYIVVEDETYNDGIMSISPVKVGFPTAARIEYTCFNSESIPYDAAIPFDSVRAIHSYKGRLSFSHIANNEDGIGYIDLAHEQYKSTGGKLLSRVYDMGSRVRKKEIVEINVRGVFGNDKTTLNVYIDDYPTPFSYVLPSTTGIETIRIDTIHVPFTTLQIECEIKGWLNSQIADKIYGIEIVYNVIEE